MTVPIFQLSAVGYRYSRDFTALAGIDLEVRGGESVALLGANGCGKSTLLKLLNGLVFPTSGTLRAYGEPLSEERLETDAYRRFFRSRVGFVFQNPDVQLFSPTVFDELAFGPLQLDLPEEETAARVEELLQLLGLRGVRDRSPHQLSGGEKKKVAIASVLAMNPEVLLLDEPTGGLDPRTQRWLVELIAELSLAGKTIVTATHDLSMVGEIASRAIVLNEEHRIVAQGGTAAILGDLDLLLAANLISERPYTHTHIHYPWHRHD